MTTYYIINTDYRERQTTGNITVKNTGDGEVLANHVAATAEGIVTVAPAETTDSEGISPQTSEALNFVAVVAVMAAAMAILCGAYTSARKER